MPGLLDVLADEDRATLLGRARVRRFGRNEIVFHEGDPGDSLHIVERGLFLARTHSTSGNVLTVNTFVSGEFFGELALVSASPRRTATVVAIEPGETRAVYADDFEELRADNPRIDRFLVSILAERNRQLTAQVTELMFTPTHKRVHRELLRLADRRIGVDADGWIRLGQHELAELTGSTRATVNRALQSAAAHGAVQMTRGRTRIVDGEVLRRLAR